MSGLINWSTDAASNDVSDPPILWQEGQPASTVNNSAREVMAALAKWRVDNSGVLTAGRGAADLYGVATVQGFSPDAIAQPHTLAFNVSTANQGPVTLSLDSLPPVPLRRMGNIELAPGDLSPGIIYRVVRTASVYVIVSPTFAEPSKVDIFASSDVPAGWLLCDGRAVSRTAYAALFQRIGGRFGAGDGSTTFNVPDVRGRTIFGVDSGAGRLTGAGGLAGLLGSVGGLETVALTEAQLASHGHGGSTGSAGAHDHGGAVSPAGQHSHSGATGGAGEHNHTGVTDGGGGHSHTGSTDAGGAHVHPINYNRLGIYQLGGSGVAVNEMYPGAFNSGGATDSAGTSSGQHQHGLTTSGVADHAHGFLTNIIADHAHSISADGQHAHGISAVGDHAHSLTISAAGGGQGHANVSPGIVLTIAIKA